MMLSFALVFLPSCLCQWSGGGGAEGAGGNWNPPGGMGGSQGNMDLGPVPPEFAAAMNGPFGGPTNPPPLPNNYMMAGNMNGMMGGGYPQYGMMGNGQGMMGGNGGMMGHGMMGNNGGQGGGGGQHAAQGGAAGGKKAAKQPAVEYEPPEHPQTTKAPAKSNMMQALKPEGAAAISMPANQGGMGYNGGNQYQPNPRRRQNNMFNQQMQMGGGQRQQQQQYSQQQKLGIMAQFSNSMNQMMGTFNAIRASLGQLINTLSKFVKLQ